MYCLVKKKNMHFYNEKTFLSHLKYSLESLIQRGNSVHTQGVLTVNTANVKNACLRNFVLQMHRMHLINSKRTKQKISHAFLLVKKYAAMMMHSLNISVAVFVLYFDMYLLLTYSQKCIFSFLEILCLFVKACLTFSRVRGIKYSGYPLNCTFLNSLPTSFLPCPKTVPYCLPALTASPLP